MLRAVLDANVVLSALIRPEGPPGPVLRRLLKERAFQLVISPAIAAELRRSVRYPRIRKHLPASAAELEAWISSLELIAEVVEGRTTIPAATADPDDDKYVVAELEGRADFIVSGDEHLLALGDYEGVRVVNPRVFLRVLERQVPRADAGE